MIAWISTDENGRICASTTDERFAIGMTQVEVDDDFDFTRQMDYVYKDGKLTCDNAYTNEQEPARAEHERKLKEDAQLQIAARMFVRTNSNTLTDKQALAVPLLFDEWSVGVEYEKDHIVRYNDELYRIGQNHTSQEQWIPGSTGTDALYSHIVIGEDGYEEWKRWDGVTGLYGLGQIVRDPDDGQLYKSRISNNTYGPPHDMPDYWELYVK